MIIILHTVSLSGENLGKGSKCRKLFFLNIQCFDTVKLLSLLFYIYDYNFSFFQPSNGNAGNITSKDTSKCGKQTKLFTFWVFFLTYKFSTIQADVLIGSFNM